MAIASTRVSPKAPAPLAFPALYRDRSDGTILLIAIDSKNLISNILPPGAPRMPGARYVATVVAGLATDVGTVYPDFQIVGSDLEPFIGSVTIESE